MKTETRLFSESKGLATAIDESLNHCRPYTRKEPTTKFYSPEFARFKLWVHLDNGRHLTRYSFDEVYSHEKKKKIRDEWDGLTRLIRLISKYDNVITAVVFASDCPIKRTSEKNYNIQVYKMVKNRGVQKNTFVSFLPCGTLDISKFNAGNSYLKS